MDFQKELEGIPTGNICDCMPEKRAAMDSGIKPLDRNMRVVGTALTVACAAGDNLTIHKAVLEAKPGDVLVVNCGGFVGGGVFGELLATACAGRGIVGVVVDGSTRDTNDLIEMNFPTFSRGICPDGTGKGTCGAIGAPVPCGGKMVHNGDLIVGDCDGVVVVPAEMAEEVVQKAKEKKAFEDDAKQKLEAGATTAELFHLAPYFK